jgi:hypothetical protein
VHCHPRLLAPYSPAHLWEEQHWLEGMRGHKPATANSLRIARALPCLLSLVEDCARHLESKVARGDGEDILRSLSGLYTESGIRIGQGIEALTPSRHLTSPRRSCSCPHSTYREGDPNCAKSGKGARLGMEPPPYPLTALFELKP